MDLSTIIMAVQVIMLILYFFVTCKGCLHDPILSDPIHFQRMEFGLLLTKHYSIGFS